MRHPTLLLSLALGLTLLPAPVPAQQPGKKEPFERPRWTTGRAWRYQIERRIPPGEAHRPRSWRQVEYVTVAVGPPQKISVWHPRTRALETVAAHRLDRQLLDDANKPVRGVHVPKLWVRPQPKELLIYGDRGLGEQKDYFGFGVKPRGPRLPATYVRTRVDLSAQDPGLRARVLAGALYALLQLRMPALRDRIEGSTPTPYTRSVPLSRLTLKHRSLRVPAGRYRTLMLGNDWRSKHGRGAVTFWVASGVGLVQVIIETRVTRVPRVHPAVPERPPGLGRYATTTRLVSYK